MKLSKVLACFIVTVLCCSLQSQTKAKEDSSDSVHKFVQDFYDWYAPGAAKAADERKEFNWETRASDFDPALLSALKEDEDAQAKAKGEIVGIDFDPFLASQDPCAPYKARNVVQKGDRFLVSVDCACENVTGENPAVTVELVMRDGHWVFVNFHYPEPKPSGSNLLGILKRNQRTRQRPSK